MQSGLFLNVVVRKSAAILKLLSSKNQPLLIWWNTLLVLNLRLDVINGVGRFNLESDGLSSKSLDDYERVRGKKSVNESDGNDLQICIPPRRRRTKWRVDSFWML